MFSISKIFIYFLSLIVIYNVITYSELLNNNFPQNSTFSSNVEIGEKYFYADKVSDVVFIGSSITNIVGFEKINNSICIPYTGSTALEPLKLINNKEEKPKKVFVEVNTLYTPESGISDQVMFLSDIRGVLPSLHQKNKPLIKLMWILTVIKDKILYELNFNINDGKRITYKKVDKERYIRVREMVKPDTSQIVYNISMLEKELLKLKESNVECFLIEIPVNERIIYGKRHEYLINKLYELSKKININLLRFDKDEYSWSDGVHMTKDSKNSFQENLVKRLSFLELKQ